MSKLIALHFAPGMVVSVGGKYTALSFWDAKKHPELACERQQNGDAVMFWKDDPRLRRLVRDKFIAWEMHEVEDKPGVKPEVKK